MIIIADYHLLVSSVGSAPMEVSGGRPATPGPGDRSRQRLPWEPLDLTNPGYELVLAGRRKSAMATDFVQRNIVRRKPFILA